MFMRSKFANNAFLNFDLMINLLVTRMIIRSKFANNAFRVLISWSKCQSPDQYQCKLWSHQKGEFWSHDRNFNLMKKLNFDLMKFDLMIISQISIEENNVFVPSRQGWYHMIKILDLKIWPKILIQKYQIRSKNESLVAVKTFEILWQLSVNY